MLATISPPINHNLLDYVGVSLKFNLPPRRVARSAFDFCMSRRSSTPSLISIVINCSGAARCIATTTKPIIRCPTSPCCGLFCFARFRTAIAARPGKIGTGSTDCTFARRHSWARGTCMRQSPYLLHSSLSIDGRTGELVPFINF